MTHQIEDAAEFLKMTSINLYSHEERHEMVRSGAITYTKIK